MVWPCWVDGVNPLKAPLAEDNVIWSLPRPARHGDVLLAMVKQGLDPKNLVMGFIDQNGLFYDREKAWTHAVECQQTLYFSNPFNSNLKILNKYPETDGLLFSENLWWYLNILLIFITII